MKGMLLKDSILLKKNMILSAVVFLFIGLLFVLVRISMEHGNLAKDEEIRQSLLSNQFLFYYISPLVLFLMGVDHVAGTIGLDMTSGWMRFLFSETGDRSRYVRGKICFTVLEYGGMLLIAFGYLWLMTALSGESITWSRAGNLSIIWLLCLSAALLQSLLTVGVENKEKAQIIMMIPIILLYFVFSGVMINKLEEMYLNDGSTPLDVLREELMAAQSWLIPAAVIGSAVILTGGYFLSVEFLKRREIK